MNRKVILASASPRRRELLEQIGLSFTVSVAEIDEQRLPKESPDALVKRLAFEKASTIQAADSIVIAADTVVALGDDVLGKPKDAEDAAQMLRMLSGRTHHVYTGFCVRDDKGTSVSEVVATEVVFRELSNDEIKAYVASGEPMDKAGAYGIQGGAAPFISEIHGDYYNVVGLPLCRLVTVLREAFDWTSN